MKKLVLTLLFAGLLAGPALAAEEQKNPCLSNCACDNSQVDRDGSVFKPLFPEYEAKLPLGG